MILSEFISPAIDAITKSDQTRLDMMLESLIEENIAQGNPRFGFLLGGEFHTLMDPKSVPLDQKKHLHRDLVAQGLQYTQEREQYRKEQERLRHGINSMLSPCKSLQDARDQLPEPIVGLFPTLAEFKRRRSPGCMCADQPLKAHDFKLIEDLVTFYVSNRLLY